MINRVIGSVGLYLEGLEPSRTPPCDGALAAVAEAVAAEVVVDDIVFARAAVRSV